MNKKTLVIRDVGVALRKISTQCTITLPRAWMRKNNITEGDTVSIVFDRILRVIPSHDEHERIE